MGNITEWINNELYPTLFNNLNSLLPEFDFRKINDKWISTTKQKVTGELGESKGKVYIYENNPGFIIDYTREGISLIKYFESKGNNFNDVLTHLSKEAGLKLPQNTKFDSNNYKGKIENNYIIKDFSNQKLNEITNQENLKPYSRIEFQLFQKSLKGYENNSFAKYLLSLFGIEITEQLIEKYNIGSSKHWNNIGACVFWQVDYFGEIRTGKIMAYDSTNGKRIKKPFNHINWVHNIIGEDSFNLQQCYFGEHLLRSSINKKIAIVESEKTAIIASVYFPQYVWIASGSLNNLSITRSDFLNGRQIVLFPDLSKEEMSYSLWEKKAETLKEVAKSVEMFDILEKLAPQLSKEKGWDIVDFLTQINIKEWSQIEKIQTTWKTIELNQFGYPENWDTEEQKEFNNLTTKQKMIKKNPLLNDLITKFSLIER